MTRHTTHSGRRDGSTPRLRQVFPRPVAALCLTVLLAQALLLVALVGSPAVGRPHEVPLSVVTSPVLAAAVAAEIDRLPGEPFHAVPAPGRRPARDDLRDGRTLAVLTVRPAFTRDVLHLHRDRDPALNAAVRAVLEERARAAQRTLTVRYAGSRLDDEPAATGAFDVTLAAHVAGFLLIVALSLRFGPVARTLRLGVRRVVAVGVLAVAVGTVLAVLPGTAMGRDPAGIAATTALAVAVAGVTTLALEAVAGLAGLALVATLFLLTATPVLTRTDVHLLPEPWRTLTPYAPPGATVEALGAVAAHPGQVPWRPVLVLVGWLALGVLTLLAARRSRPLPGVSLDAGAAATGQPGRLRHLVVWRLRVAALVVPTAALMLGGLLAMPDGRAAASLTDVVATESGCARLGELRSVADLNALVRRPGRPEFEGGDVGAEVLVQDGRRLWFFGDTLRGAGYGDRRLVRNSVLVTGDGCLRAVVSAEGGAVMPDRADGVGYWPMSVVRLQRRGYDVVVVTAQRVRSTGEGLWDFEALGPALAAFVVRTGQTPQLVALRDVGPDDADPARPVWGAAAVADGGWVYLYGTATTREPYVFGYSLRVARAPADEVLDPSSWRYWDGAGWGAEARDAAELIPPAGGVSQTLSVFRKQDRWFVLSKRDDFVGTDVVVWAAESPTGPFGAGEPVAYLPSDHAAGVLRYTPLAHPDLLPTPGSVVVSYSENRTDFGQVLEDPTRYRPRFLRVRLPGGP